MPLLAELEEPRHNNSSHRSDVFKELARELVASPRRSTTTQMAVYELALQFLNNCETSKRPDLIPIVGDLPAIGTSADQLVAARAERY